MKPIKKQFESESKRKVVSLIPKMAASQIQRPRLVSMRMNEKSNIPDKPSVHKELKSDK
jgi:hypothetical protein